MVWARLKAWLFGGESAEESAEAEPSTKTESEPSDGAVPESDYRCAVCGTEVEDPEAACPLCGASDITTGTGESQAEQPGPASERVANDETDPAERLRELRGDLLLEHREKWEREGESYRVRAPDGEWRRAADEGAVREVLREY